MTIIQIAEERIERANMRIVPEAFGSAFRVMIGAADKVRIFPAANGQWRIQCDVPDVMPEEEKRRFDSKEEGEAYLLLQQVRGFLAYYLAAVELHAEAKETESGL